jgi:dipeptidyl aminopeptidase/acylaminoacyl peptidase/tetratricopeptide (TPR) repeat protein
MSAKATLVLCALALVPPHASRAEDRRPLRVDDLFALRDVGGPQISPDGASVLFTVRGLDPVKDKADTDIYRIPMVGGEAVRLTTSPKAETRPRYSPDGRQIAFLSGREGKKTQVFLMPATGGEAVKLTDYKGGVDDLAWSPDGTRLALVVNDPDPDERPEDETKGEGDAKKTPKPIVLERLQFKHDEEGFLRELRAHIHVFEVATKTTAQVTSGPYDDASPVWSPDGQAIAFVSNRTPDPDSNRNSDVFLVAPRENATVKALTTAPTEAKSPSFSPDGKLVAYVEGGDPADMWYATDHVAVVPVAGGESRPLTKALDRNPVGTPRFSPDGRFILFLVEDRGNVHLARVPVAGGAVEKIVTGDRVLSSFELGGKGDMVVVESRTDLPKELSRITPAGLQRLTHVNDKVLEGIKLSPVTRHVAKSADGTLIDYFLIRPPDAPAGAKLPAILRIHGGPVSQYQSEWSFEWQLLAAQGYLVVSANPRGSSGRGRDFSRAIWADWGGKDFEDVMAAVDAAVAMGAADPDRLGVGGWSYGGILTDWTIYRSSRFKAAIAGAGIANVFAGYGTDHYQFEYEAELGLPWKNTAGWAKLSKPFLEADKIKTPTLFLCGEVDWNVPLIHSEQMYQALRRLGVPTGLVVYPGESHGLKVPSYQKDRYERYLAWYDRYLKPAPAAVASAPEATSLQGQALLVPEIAPEQKKALDEKLAAATAAFVADPDAADNIYWLGRRLSSLGRFREAIATFSRGVERYPADVRFLRFRGHRYISVREFDKALADLTKAAQLIAERKIPDAPEPVDRGVAPATDASSLHYGVYYHLGLAHYLRGEYAQAEEAYRLCLKASGSAPGNQTGALRWLYVTLRRLGRDAEASSLLSGVSAETQVKDGAAYRDLLLLYKGLRTPAQLLALARGDLDHPTYGYGVGEWLLLNGQKEAALDLFREATRGRQWAAFGHIASEVELARVPGQNGAR